MYKQANAGDIDGFISVFNEAGSHLWTRLFGGSDTDELYHIAINGNRVYAAGKSLGDFSGIENQGGYDLFAVSLDVTGKTQ